MGLPTRPMHVAVYTGPIKEALKSFKYGKKKYFAIHLARLLTEFIKQNNIEHFELIIPVPLHWKKEFARGFNQSALLSVYLGRNLHKKCLLGNLTKTRNTISQTKLSGSKRTQNVKGSFKIRKPELIKNKDILLIDDIYTTGATTQEIKGLLKKQGARSINILTVALAEK